jgi:hypothetical protein
VNLPVQLPFFRVIRCEWHHVEFSLVSVQACAEQPVILSVMGLSWQVFRCTQETVVRSSVQVPAMPEVTSEPLRNFFLSNVPSSPPS